MIDTEKLLHECEHVLDINWNGNFTIPAATLYPHQWSWDAAFIAIGNSYNNTNRAIAELEFLFDAQWKNGMVPHIVFNKKEKTYFPAADFYEINRSTNAPTHIGTSGMTQPPVHAIACLQIYQNSTNKDKTLDFLKRIFPKLVKFHRYLMTERDPEQSGLVTIFHPWESGLDDSPIWDEPLSRITISKNDLPEFKRLDVIAVDGASDTVPDDEEYKKFIYLIEIMKKYNYSEKEMYENLPFKIKDIIFSSILYVANKCLLEIAKIIEKDDKTINNNNSSPYQYDKSDINIWLKRTENNFYKYFLPSSSSSFNSEWNKSELRLYFDYDLVTKDWIKKKTISSLMPIFTGILSKEEVDTIIKWMTRKYRSEEGRHINEPLLPSTDLKVDYFKEVTYWRGPVWINVNWMFWLGLLQYGYKREAEIIRQGIFDLVHKHGIREYYDPFDGRGLGGKNFSWTAALVIDMIKKIV
ncbi:MAG TPA: trehalase family glycosidase [Nitrososphaeraceae archaeon]|nr:trehalase family glycosidase [Nitrososphaeraceae archaeon]